ncbi:RimK/LysX family protein [Shewanella sp. D64]|uniref:putative ATP-dependent zinc protease n=1 Tax=unclassified Shewanella TaxID=196818 RepID=UPI0022BA24B8|nr:MULTISPECIES: RimK/LysX family protein [unclassified Shewanella]MEC4724898.1 RimK/LysX family protein [Shewanella sp. D64]MEC4736309.1 RimK/LysX family protein [Shewanella sp. E94]WBJ97629.1 RimK/LysX family protein [Shewanella sp. MTB7]
MVKVIGFCFLLLTSASWAGDKAIIGASANMSVSETGLNYQARIDTGAGNTSLHAYDLEIEGGSAKKMKDNVGKMLMFTTENEAGEQKRLKGEIVKTSTVSNSQGRETRYMVELHIGENGHERKVKVNLRDRSHMDYKLLIGRNWLNGRYIVDVSDKKVIGPVASISIIETGMMFKTRIDTGAVENSLHAVDLHVENGVKDMDKNLGKMLSFTTENEKGETQRVHAMIIETSLIRNAQGSEVRYMVELNIGEKDQEYKVKVNLRDRSKMSHKLLIGRNWIQGHYLVDVSR